MQSLFFRWPKLSEAVLQLREVPFCSRTQCMQVSSMEQLQILGWVSSLEFWIKCRCPDLLAFHLPRISAHWLSLTVALCCRMRRRGIASALAGGVEEGCCRPAGGFNWEFRASGTDGNMYREKEAERSCDVGMMHWLHKKYWSNKVCFPEVGRVGSKFSVVSEQFGCGVFWQKTAWYQTVFLVWV